MSNCSCRCKNLTELAKVQETIIHNAQQCMFAEVLVSNQERFHTQIKIAQGELTQIRELIEEEN